MVEQTTDTQFAGEFETHLTLKECEQAEMERLARWSAARGWKFVHIVLSRGQSASQPMLTWHSKGTLGSELERAEEARRDCEEAGFFVSRVKLEVAPFNPDVPQSARDGESNRRYFEHHVKVLLPPDAQTGEIQQAIQAANAHLSRNARRFRPDGRQERFVTQRCYNVGRREAKEAFDELLRCIGALPFPIVETEEEFVVFDSNLALDAGWFDDAASAL